MVALLSNVIQSFRCVLSLFPSVSYLTTSQSSVGHHNDIPLPQVIHKTLNKEFIDGFDEVLVIGDIHGCYDELIQLLDQIKDNYNTLDSNDSNNNPNSNRNRILKLFVGDLVNKGPKSSEVLNLLMNNSDSCLSVRGNHDEVVISEYLKFEKEGESGLKEKNIWMKELNRKQINYLIAMPYTISIPSLNALVVHAGIVPNVDLKQQRYKDMIEMRNLYESKEETNSKVKVLTPSESLKEGQAWVNYWTGPQHIYFGHDARRKLQRNKFSTGLDTGCVYGNQLTALFIYGSRSGSFVTIKANAVHSQPKVNQSSQG